MFCYFHRVNRCATQAVSYLHSRGINYELIDYCIQTGRLYESYPHHNVVFVGFDKQGKKRYASLRGTGGTRFMGDVNGSDKQYSFALSTVHLFESAVDLLSYATLCPNWKSENLLSLAGVYQPKKDIQQSKIPAARTRFLEDYSHIKTIVLHLDNDTLGRMAAKAIMTVLPKEYTVLNKQPPVGKDCNDYLLYRIRHRQNERTDER